ncbi:MAG: helix-turn-helix domain-containing protein [Massilia sp.]
MQDCKPEPFPQPGALPADGRMMLAPQRLKAQRLRLGLSQEALAEYCSGRRLCVSIASIKRAESGRPILYRTARHLALAYEVPLDALVSDRPLP